MVGRLRVFISSPGDVRDAREVAAQTVEAVAHDYLRHFVVEPYMWESEALLASGHFQDAIEPPSQFDIVTLILWSRLGTPLPLKTEVRSYAGIDGRAPVTGTEWEFEDALRSARDRGLPDLLVYRSRRPAQVDSWDAVRRTAELDQMSALDRFWARHFADQGAYLGAYRQFERLEEFAADLERDLRRLLDRRVAASSDVATERRWPGSPFRGLEAFDCEHAPIFFGRDAEAGRAVGQLIVNAERGHAFLLVCGASGSGKSSLVRAGLAPRLALPRRVFGKSFVRRIMFRPSEMLDGEDLFDALARALVASPHADAGLPELGRPERLAGVLREGAQHAPAFIEAALDALTEAGRKSGRLLAHEEATVLLIVDQLEELYADRRITADHRTAFAALVAALVGRARVWVVATLRADFWHRVSETPALIALCEGHGRLDLLAPGLAQISQMIRLGAEAAGLSYEAAPEDGVALGDRIAEEAARAPGALPLLSYLLEQLYEADAVQAGRSVLTYETYERLGRLSGSIATRAEAVLRDQSAETRDALPSLLFRLVDLARDADGAAGLVARRAPLDTFGEGPARRLADAFLAAGARLLVADTGPDGAPVLRVAHEALLREWGRARELIQGNERMMATRRMVEERHGRWADLGRRDDALLRNADLADGRRLLAERRSELGPAIVSYIVQSDRREKVRRRGLVAAACGATALVAVLVVGGAEAGYFIDNFAQMSKTEVLVLDSSRFTDWVVGNDAFKAGDYNGAVTQYAKALGEAQQTVQIQPRNPQWRANLAFTQVSLGFAYLRRNTGSDLALSRTEFAAANASLAAAAALSPRPQLAADIDATRKQLAPYLPR